MFHAGIIPTKDQVQFGDFRSCLSIFNKSTNLQNNNKNREIGNTYLAPTNRPTCRPSPASRQRAACRPGRQAGARRRPQRAPRTCSPPRRSPRPVTSWIGLPLSPEPPRHPLSSPAPPPRAPPPWPTPPSPCLRRSRAPRHPCVLSSCPGAPPLSTSSSSRAPSARNARVHRNDLARTAVAGDPLQRRRRSGPSPAAPRASSNSP